MGEAIRHEIERYLKTGGSDPKYLAWEGDSFLDRARRGSRDLTSALVDEVKRLQQGIRTRGLPRGLKVGGFAREKLAPMVRGLFPRVEQEIVLDVLASSVAFVHRRNVEKLLRRMSFHRSAWDLANLYLHNIGAETLGPDAPAIVGMSIEKTSYVSTAYFEDTGPFEDFVVHEAAHVFHNCKRRTIDLPHTRRKEWLLPIAFRKRELFAYSCEAYSRILELARSPAHRKELLDEYRAGHVPSALGDQEVDHLEILANAVAARNGWKHILAHCQDDQ